MGTMRCTVAHWQGHEFIPAGTLLSDGDARLIPEFFTPVEGEEPKPKTRTRKAAAKVAEPDPE